MVAHFLKPSLQIAFPILSTQRRNLQRRTPRAFCKKTMRHWPCKKQCATGLVKKHFHLVIPSCGAEHPRYGCSELLQSHHARSLLVFNRLLWFCILCKLIADSHFVAKYIFCSFSLCSSRYCIHIVRNKFSETLATSNKTVEKAPLLKAASDT